MARGRYLVLAEGVRLERHTGVHSGVEGAMLVPEGRVHLARPGSATALCGLSTRGLVAFPAEASVRSPTTGCDECRSALGTGGAPS